jgi:hypothetical protein
VAALAAPSAIAAGGAARPPTTFPGVLHLKVEGHVEAAGVLLSGLQPQRPAQLLDLALKPVPVAKDGNVVACKTDPMQNDTVVQKQCTLLAVS